VMKDNTAIQLLQNIIKLLNICGERYKRITLINKNLITNGKKIYHFNHTTPPTPQFEVTVTDQPHKKEKDKLTNYYIEIVTKV